MVYFLSSFRSFFSRKGKGGGIGDRNIDKFIQILFLFLFCLLFLFVWYWFLLLWLYCPYSDKRIGFKCVNFWGGNMSKEGERERERKRKKKRRKEIRLFVIISEIR